MTARLFTAPEKRIRSPSHEAPSASPLHFRFSKKKTESFKAKSLSRSTIKAFRRNRHENGRNALAESPSHRAVRERPTNRGGIMPPAAPLRKDDIQIFMGFRKQPVLGPVSGLLGLIGHRVADTLVFSSLPGRPERPRKWQNPRGRPSGHCAGA